MTQDEIIEMAKQADWPDSLIAPVIMAKLNDFAKLVAQHEREACAKVCEDDFGNGALNLADAIRARSNT